MRGGAARSVRRVLPDEELKNNVNTKLAELSGPLAAQIRATEAAYDAAHPVAPLDCAVCTVGVP